MKKMQLKLIDKNNMKKIEKYSKLISYFHENYKDNENIKHGIKK